MILFTGLILLVAIERLVELVVSRRNAAWSFSHGGHEYGGGHYPAMVALHSALLIGALAEVGWGHRPFLPWLGWPMLALVVASQILRWWCIGTLGRRWNTRIIVIPGMPLVRAGPYAWLTHPNYVAVVVEGAALPLVHSAWLTAAAFTALNLVLLRTRVRAEDEALTTAQST
ncbi:MAG: isoprenylcysteine carboxyl methyltransferase family protein [Nocardioidaceae bacterium]